MSSKPERSKHFQAVVGLLMGGLLVRATIAFFLPAGFDEAYYYLYTRHLDWGYFDHPPMVALTTGLGIWLSGEVSVFTIRFGSLLLHTGALLLLYLAASRLFSQRAAWLTLTIATLVPIFLMGFGVLTLPDSPLIFFWTATLFITAYEFFPPCSPSSSSLPYQPTWRLTIAGLFTGLACLSKYHGLALGFGLISFCLISRRHRPALRSLWLLGGVGLFLLAISPIAIWNVQHDWISLRFQSGRAIPDRGYSFLDLLSVFLVGNAYLFPSLGFPLWWALGRSLRSLLHPAFSPSTSPPSQRSVERSSQNLPTCFLLCLSLPLILTFTLMGGYRPILPTWAAPGFWSATLLVGQWAATGSDRSLRRWLGGSALAIATLVLMALLHLTIGSFQKPGQFAIGGGFLPVSTDASVQLIDTQQLRRQLAASPQVRSALTQTDFVFTSDIFFAGQVGLAIAPLSDRPITCLSEDLRGFAFWSKGEQWVGQNGLYLVPRRLTTLTAQYAEYFSHIEKIAEVALQRGGVTVEVIQIYRCENLLKPYPRPYGN